MTDTAVLDVATQTVLTDDVVDTSTAEAMIADALLMANDSPRGEIQVVRSHYAQQYAVQVISVNFARDLGFTQGLVRASASSTNSTSRNEGDPGVRRASEAHYRLHTSSFSLLFFLCLALCASTLSTRRPCSTRRCTATSSLTRSSPR